MAEQHNESYWITVLTYFASFLIGLGIIAEIAFNWQQIPNVAKLIGAIVAMLVNAGALIWCIKHQKNILTQVTACIYAFLIMGVIGLIGQVFQLQSNAANACLLWAMVSWPLFCVAPRLLWLWIPLFFYGIRYLPSVISEEIRADIFGEWSLETSKNLMLNSFYRWFGVVGAYGLLCTYELWQNCRTKTNLIVAKPLQFYSGIVVWGLYCRAVFYAEHMDMPWGFLHEIVVPAILLAGIFWLLNKRQQRFSFMPIFLIGLFAEYFLMLIWQYFKEPQINLLPNFARNIPTTEQQFPLIYLVLMFMYSYYHKMSRLRTLSIMALVMWFILTYSYDMFDLTPSLIVCGSVGVCAYYARNRKWFNVAVIAAVLRVLGEYAYVDNLQYFGLYLIIAGVLLILTITFLTKFSHKLWEKIDEK